MATAGGRGGRGRGSRRRGPAAARRHFLLFFDLDFTEPTFIGEAQQAALHLVRDGLEPTDLVGVAFFHGRSGGSSVIGFTSDREQVIEALEELGELVGRRRTANRRGGARQTTLRRRAGLDRRRVERVGRGDRPRVGGRAQPGGRGARLGRQ